MSSQITAKITTSTEQETRVVDVTVKYVTLKMPVADAEILYGMLGCCTGYVTMNLLLNALRDVFGKNVHQLPLANFIYESLSSKGIQLHNLDYTKLNTLRDASRRENQVQK